MKRILPLLSFLALLSVASCADERNVAERGPLGKTDAFGSCIDSGCDGPSPFGACFCDSDCAEFGDCCADKVEICDAPVSQSCGGRVAGNDCSDGEYCHYETEKMCGAGDQLGTCLPVPEVCTKEFLPVCGCDGSTYSNSCMASAAGTSILHEGACDQQPVATCGGFAGFTCAADEYCQYELSQTCGFGDQLGTCQPKPQACLDIVSPEVCGCDGTTYPSECHANGAGVSIAGTAACFNEPPPVEECEEALDCFNAFGPPSIECVGAHWECNANSCSQSC